MLDEHDGSTPRSAAERLSEHAVGYGPQQHRFNKRATATDNHLFDLDVVPVCLLRYPRKLAGVADDATDVSSQGREQRLQRI